MVSNVMYVDKYTGVRMAVVGVGMSVEKQFRLIKGGQL